MHILLKVECCFTKDDVPYFGGSCIFAVQIGSEVKKALKQLFENSVVVSSKVEFINIKFSISPETSLVLQLGVVSLYIPTPGLHCSTYII